MLYGVCKLAESGDKGALRVIACGDVTLLRGWLAVGIVSSVVASSGGEASFCETGIGISV